MKNIFKNSFFAIALLVYTSNAFALSPKDAISKLKEGNERFVAGQTFHPNITADRLGATAKDGQFPFATVIACSDSRVPVEILFDQGVGDLFVIKVAGNVSDVDEIGSMEYGTEHLKTPVLVVLGHTHCGAVTAVVKGAELHGSLPGLVDNIKPAFEKTAKEHSDLHGDDLVNATIKANVYQSIADILSKSTMISKLVKSGSLEVVAAIYNLDDGRIEWLGEHPDQAHLIANAKDASHDDVQHKEQSFLSTPNLIYMAIFVAIVSLIASLMIFILTRKK